MKIIIVDDDCLVAGALKTILEVNEDVEVLATGADGKEDHPGGSGRNGAL